ncbi:MFS transporter [Faecalispora anaeroviscerum]|uniref:MFS transporter n=1 Tax=Faecalispora anaeroviscerum TaxID=2991836 RepID=UPI0024B9D055|nr:MFS transporter [Faecalispora anaeroviscerum]
MEEQRIKVSSTRAILIEMVMFFTYAFFAVNWIAGSTLTPQIMKYFKLESFASATLISNAITIAKIIGNFMAAGILIKLFPKKAIGLGSGLIVAGSALAVLAPQYWIFILGRFCMGFGGALYVVYFSPMVIHYFTPEKRPTVNALNGVAYNVGGILAMLIVGPVIRWLETWQYSMAFFAAISGVLFLAWPVLGQDFEMNRSSGAVAEKYTAGDALKEKFNWFLPFTYSGLLTFYIVLLNIFPISGATAINSKTLSILVAAGGVVGSILAILLAKVYFRRLPVIRWSGLAMTLFGVLMFYTSSGMLSMIAAFAIGMFMFLPITSLMTIPQELPNMTPAKLTTIMGLFWALSYVIESVAYYLIGVVIDKSGYSAGLTIALVMSATFFLGSFLLPETGRVSKEKKQ